ncbi:MAG: phage portal protein [Planctomycetales bacterium]
MACRSSCRFWSALQRFDQWMETELQARRLQASIVLWRKVRGSPAEVAQFAEQAQSASGASDGIGGVRRERFRAGTILTTSQGTELQFLQPNTNFADSIPLGRMLLLSMSAGEGLPEFMLTSDAANGNYASTMVAEGPAVKMFQGEQQFFTAEFTKLWRWVMQQGIGLGLLPEDFFEVISLRWGTPTLVNRDRNKERLADARLVETGILSRAEVGRREGVDPVLMQKEISRETDGEGG